MQTTQKQTVLLVEDDASIADTVNFALQREGFETTWCSLAYDALNQAQQQHFDFFILDVGLPDMNGFELCKALRQHSQMPILFLTARSDEIDRVVGLEIGGDDYMIKPFSPRELVARVKVILRRLSAPSPPQTEAFTPPAVASTSLPPHDQQHFHVDTIKAKISYHDTVLSLTRYEYRILSILMTHPQQVYSREQLIQQAWEDPNASFDRAIDTHIKTLRAKLKTIASDKNPIKTHRGLGYSFDE